MSPRDHEVLDHLIDAISELQTIRQAIAGVVERSRALLAKAEDAAIEGDVVQDAVSPLIRTMLRETHDRIAGVERQNAIERRVGCCSEGMVSWRASERLSSAALVIDRERSTYHPEEFVLQLNDPGRAGGAEVVAGVFRRRRTSDSSHPMTQRIPMTQE